MNSVLILPQTYWKDKQGYIFNELMASPKYPQATPFRIGVGIVRIKARHNAHWMLPHLRAETKECLYEIDPSYTLGGIVLIL